MTAKPELKEKKPTNTDLLELQEGLERVQVNLPLPLSHKLSKIRIDVDDTLRPFFEEKKRIVKMYSKKDKKGNIQMDENGNIEFDDISAAQDALDQLGAIECDIKLDKVSIKDFPKKKDISSKGLSQLKLILSD